MSNQPNSNIVDQSGRPIPQSENWWSKTGRWLAKPLNTIGGILIAVCIFVFGNLIWWAFEYSGTIDCINVDGKPWVKDGQEVGRVLSCTVVNNTKLTQAIVGVIVETSFTGESNEVTQVAEVFPSGKQYFRLTTLENRRYDEAVCMSVSTGEVLLNLIHLGYPPCTFVDGEWRVKIKLAVNGDSGFQEFKECVLKVKFGDPDSSPSSTKLIDRIE